MAGDYDAKLFIIRQGRVKVVKPLVDGNEQIIRILNEGDFFGDTSVFHDQPYTTNIEALEVTHICMLDGAEVKAILAKSPNVLFEILKQLSLRIEDIEHNMSEICHRDVASRVASFLIRQKSEDSYVDNVSKKDMASILGTTRESISRKLSQFQRDEIIQIDKERIHIKNEQELLEIANRV